MSLVAIPASAMRPFAEHALTEGQDGLPVWLASAHQGWFLCSPPLSVSAGVYRVKIRAEVDGPPTTVSYFDVFDASADGRIFAAHMYRRDPEVFVRLYESHSLEIRFSTDCESVRIYGLEIEPLLLDSERVSPDIATGLAERLVAGGAEPAALFRVLSRLADLGEIKASEEIRAEYISLRTARTAEPEAWRRLLHLQAPTAELPLRLERQLISREEAQNVCLQQDFTVFDATNSTPTLRRELRSRGYQTHLFLAIGFHRSYDEPPRIWHDAADAPGRAAGELVRHALFERPTDIDRSYQTALARGDGFPAYCPITGAPLRSHHAFLVVFECKPFIFYRFEGVEVFYVCTGMNSDVRLFAYMPRAQWIVTFSDPQFTYDRLLGVVRSLNLHLIVNADLVRAYLLEDTRPAAIVGNDNYGHYYWVDMSGLQFVVENGLHHELAGIVKVPMQFGRPEEVFPELSAMRWHECSTPEEAFIACLSSGYLPVHFTDVAISAALAARMRRLARELASRAGRPPADVLRPLLWLNLRAHNKVWASQIEGYSSILNALAKDYGHCSALLDGVSDCEEIAAAIRAKCKPDVKLYNGLDFTLWDKMNWAMEADAYVCVIGTGLIICHSLAGARGVAHGNREHMTQLKFWHTIQTGSPTPLAPRPEDIRDAGTDLQRDYDVDWRILLDLLRTHLAQNFGAPQRDPPSAAIRRWVA